MGVSGFLWAGTTGRILGCAFTVHRELGPGFLESVYESALAQELAARGIGFRRQAYVPVHYRGELVGEHYLDLLVEERVVVELKAVRAVAPAHLATVLSYLKASGMRVGLILNFGKANLGIKRVVL